MSFENAMIRVSLDGSERLFAFPDRGNTRAHITNILNGKDYPLFPIGRFRPSMIVDIGANLGATALFMRHAYPGVPIVCFEPARENVEYLNRNLGGLPDVVIHPYGLSDRSSEVKLFHGRSQTLQHSTVASAEVDVSDFETIRIESTFDALFPILKPGTLLKIDTEGCEVPVLNALKERRFDLSIIYLEYHSENDRRTIDRMLEDTHIQFYCESRIAHRGNVAYVLKTLLDQVPEFARMEISQS